MSRIPQRSPLKKPQPPASPLSSSSNAKPRQKTLSIPSSPSPSLRARKSQTALKTPKSPSPSRPRRNSPELDESPGKQRPTLSIREQIALKRAEIKKSTPTGPSPGVDSPFEGLEDADPHTVNKPSEDDPNDLGRWSVRETIERARTTGKLCIRCT